MRILKKYPNWRSAIHALPSIATFLGGFSLTLMLLSLDPDIKSVEFSLFAGVVSISSHSFSLGLLSVATALFIYSLQCLLRARAYDYYDIEDNLIEEMVAEAKELRGDIKQYIAQMESKCRNWYTWGARLFNLALLFLLAGMAALILPYGWVITLPFVIGIGVEIVWLIADRIC